MCTVSIIAMSRSKPGDDTQSGRGFRVVCNRDELRQRPPAMPPEWRTIHDAAPGSADQNGRAVWPTDLAAGGTWFAASERGLVLSLLNYNPDFGLRLPAEDLAVSRGLVIPSVIEGGDAEAASARVATLELERFAPFRLVAMSPGAEPKPDQHPARGNTGHVKVTGNGHGNGHGSYNGHLQRDAHREAHLVNGLGSLSHAPSVCVIETAWDGRELTTFRHTLLPACFVSSGLGDAKVAARLDLFAELVARAGADADSQNEFHHHTWRHAPELSVMMSREDARTVSVSVAEVLRVNGSWRVSMTYRPVLEAAVKKAAFVAALRR
jgi:hypothetical protein